MKKLSSDKSYQVKKNLLGEYDRSVRLERVGELGGIDGLVLNTPGEDD